MATMAADTPQRTISSLRRRLGSFSVNIDLIDDDTDAVRTALDGCVVVRAETMWHLHTIEYIAMHADFDETPDGRTPTAYRCALTKHADGSVTRAWLKD